MENVDASNSDEVDSSGNHALQPSILMNNKTIEQVKAVSTMGLRI